MYYFTHILILLTNCIILASVVEAFLPIGQSVRRSYHFSEQFSTQSKLRAVADPPFTPAEHQDEDEKHKNAEDDGDWTATEGGFFANFAKRKPKKKTVMKTIDNIQDYKSVVVDEEDKIVVVRFHASWCRSCKTSEMAFKRIANEYPSDVKFVQVPLTKDTAYLQEGLGVPSIPFAHIYHPNAGLVEELKISKPHLKVFSDSLNSYVVGSCELPDNEDTDTVEDFQ